ncbi:hypothetical protein MNBD_GAMMA05-1894 [hydrothermal vent metagenome]|uniref:Flippase-like domain-containing protein n=1 Tax=hydrothermal vent metagenome TaxID=652676 RepID=A0A3B0WPG3_9ZZZZ
MKKLFFILKLVLTLSLLAWVIHSAGITSKEGFNEFLDEIKNANIKYVIAAFLIIPVMDFVCTIKWYFMVRAKDIVIGFWRLMGFYIVGRFFNLILPSSIGGDLIRIHFLGRHSNRYADAAAIVFLERLTGLFTLIFYVFIALFIVSKKFSSDWLFIGVVVAFVGLLFLMWVLLNEHIFLLLRNFVCRMIPSANKIFIKLEKMRKSIHDLSKNKSVMVYAFINSCLFYIAAVINAWVTLLVFNADVSFETMLLAVPIIMFIMNIPVSIGNIGIMEFAHVFVLTRFGVSGVDALSLALLMRIKMFVSAGFGGLLYIFLSPSIGSREQIESRLEELEETKQES